MSTRVLGGLRQIALVAVGALLLGGPLITAQQSTAQDQPRPTFRTEANYIRVDVYATTRDGMPVTDLHREDFELLEDRAPQTIDQFSAIEIRTGNVRPTRSDPRTPEDSRQAASEPRARVFVLFLDACMSAAKRCWRRSRPGTIWSRSSPRMVGRRNAA